MTISKVFKIISRTIGIIAICLICLITACNTYPLNLDSKIRELEEYCKQNGYNTDYAVLVDMGRMSIQKRLFVYDFKQNQILLKSFAGHGSGGNSTMLRPNFNNDHGSHCTSLGHYKIGRNRYMYNRKGVPAFELVGLDKTNSNALNRGILIHPAVGPLSWGCVTLPVVRYHQLSEFLKTQRNVIMWVYE